MEENGHERPSAVDTEPGPAGPPLDDRPGASVGPDGSHAPDGMQADDPRPEPAAAPQAAPGDTAEAQTPLFEPEPQPAPGAEAVPTRRRPLFEIPRIVALANQKGGVGKTTTALSLAASLADLGKRVLLVDFDPQGGCGIGLGVNPNALDTTVYNLLLEPDIGAQETIVPTKIPRLDLIPSNIDLAAAELVLVQEVAREQTLKRRLTPLKQKYDFILVDCPPSLGLLTVNALTAADTVIIPLECEYFALRGMAMLMDTVDKVRDRLNPDLRVEGIIATMYDARTLHAREVLERVREAFGELLFDTAIPKTIRFAEAPVAGEPITSYAPGSPGAEGYRLLAREVLGG